ncbi:hypothetical protein LVJ94_28720 [Pendulispora rubella]|uniref:Uncharacterized protein n=1 Tax=Pendulispora rubella TaxID=2741070 RepID=A0ABZ2KQF9_9BACT
MKDRLRGMLRIGSLVLAVLLTACQPTAAQAPKSPFVGVWKVDPAKSHQHTEPLRYEDLGGGRMRFSAAGASSYEFAVDGREYRSGEKRTIAWTLLAPGQWQSTLTFDGKVIETARWTSSPDGKSMNVVANGTLPNGMPYRHDKHYVREGDGTGLAGAWRNVEMNTNDMADGYVLEEDASGVVTWTIPTDNQTITGRFDGSDLPVVGATAPPGTTLSVRRISERKLAYTMKTNGKIGQVGSITISDDGRTFTEESWAPGKEDHKSTMVLGRYDCPPARAGAAKAVDKNDPNWICTARSKPAP